MAKLGSGRITLADLTDIRPAKMDLATSLEILQSQTGTAYSPDYSVGDGQVIIPSVFFGNEEIASEDYYEKIVYNCSDLGDDVDYTFEGARHNDGTKYEAEGTITEPVNGKTYAYPVYKSTYVDYKGCLHICRNLDESMIVEARVNGLTDATTGATGMSASETISLKKISAGTGYQLFIESKDNRWDFEIGGEQNIELSYKVYYDIEDVTANVVASKWYKSGEKINESQLTNIENNGTYVVSRNDVFGHETYRVAVKLNNGIVLRASVGIDDRTDSFSCELIAHGPAYLSPKNNALQVECQVWRDDTQIDTKNFKVFYNWYYLNKANNGVETATVDEGTSLGNSQILDLLYGGDVGTESFMLYCRATVVKDGKTVGYPLGKLSVNCGENFNAVLSKSVISLPCYAEGNVKNTNFSETITLSLVGDDGNFLKYNNKLDDFSISTDKNDANFTFTTSTPVDENDWVCSLTIKASTVKTDWESKNYTISYQRQGITFTIPFQIIKVRQGAKGDDGVPSFTIDLTNQFHLFAGNDFGAYSGQSIEIGFTAMLAENDISEALTELKIGDTFLVKNGVAVADAKATIATGLTATYSNKKITLSTGTGYNDPDSGNFYISFTFQNGTTIVNAITFLKSFTYGINRSGNSYTLLTDPTQVVYSPAEQTLSSSTIALQPCYQVGGKGGYISYTSGKIYYTWDGNENKKENQITLKNNKYSLNVSSSHTSYTFYLYDDANTLVDIETVPISTSMDGVEIGGENLLYYSGTFLVDKKASEGSTWQIDEAVTEESLEDSGSYKKMIFPNIISTITSPQITYTERFSGKLCFSFSMKNTSTDYSISVSILYGDKDKTIQTLVGCQYKGDFVSQAENRGYYIFNLDKAYNFSIVISAKNTQFYKPKLELGNTPTDWSANYYDNEKTLSQIQKDIKDLDTSLQSYVIKKIADSSTITTGTGKLTFIKNVDQYNNPSEEDYEDFVFTIIKDENEKSYNIVGYDAFKTYIDALNKQNAKNIATYSSTLITKQMGKLSEYTSSIQIAPAHVDDGTGEVREGSISIQTSYLDSNNNKQYKEALSLKSGKIGFWVDNKEVAYMSNEQFYIKKGQITGTLILGPEDAGKHLKIYVADDSVAWVWE